ncbi:hypothetical protein TIFTF001_015480 [Ficus carica]|uniref:Uncharacterized protein n=1 Tax=Ficus carica TaxID=3494 RepID=A0AA88A1A6_FICCA|nr:hypothetical protein TIFTF001_015480 [Ficus carica]
MGGDGERERLERRRGRRENGKRGVTMEEMDFEGEFGEARVKEARE